MGIGIIIEDEHGVRTGDSEVDDVLNTLLQLTARAERAGMQLRVLNYVDPYGNTLLNPLQQDAALADLTDLAALTQSGEERKLLNELTSLLKLSRGVPHHYVRFVGD